MKVNLRFALLVALLVATCLFANWTGDVCDYEYASIYYRAYVSPQSLISGGSYLLGVNPLSQFGVASTLDPFSRTKNLQRIDRQNSDPWAFGDFSGASTDIYGKLGQQSALAEQNGQSSVGANSSRGGLTQSSISAAANDQGGQDMTGISASEISVPSGFSSGSSSTGASPY